MNNHEHYMNFAIEKALAGIQFGQAPFGACIVKDNKVIAIEHNIVRAAIDITAHAEIHAIRESCKNLNTIDLSGCTVYSTCEPCPMCFSACYWSRIKTIVYGASIEDAANAGFNELKISNKALKEQSGSNIEIISGISSQECKELFTVWLARPDKLVY